MQEFFIVPIVDIDPVWYQRGFHHKNYALEYCRMVLGIPSDHLENANLSTNGLEINLIDSEKITEEKWYIQLRHISNHIGSRL